MYKILMDKKRFLSAELVVGAIIIISFLIKLGMILYYGDSLTLNSDDQNYIRTARILIERNIFVYSRINEPTVFITPVFPFFVAAIFKIFGSGFIGLQAVRIVQAIISSITLIYIFLIAKKMFNEKTAAATIFLVAFYPPNIVTVGYFLTEILFMLFLYMLIYHFIVASEQERLIPYIWCGAIWGIASLCRPVIALLPLAFYFYRLVIKREKFWKLLKSGIVMALAFLVVMLPWWARNFITFGEFIPLSQSGGNPMLQGTYIDYDQSNPTVYKMQETEREQNNEEMRVAKQRISDGFKNNTAQYLRWYTLGKTRLLWRWPFYWKELFGIKLTSVYLIHEFMLLGFIGLLISLITNFKSSSFYALILLYFNVSYCVYMTFDRYGYPLIPILTMFLAYMIVYGISSLKLLLTAKKA